jgi:hypothetical protein
MKKARIIENAMRVAVERAIAAGITDPQTIRSLMMAARQRILANWIE